MEDLKKRIYSLPPEKKALLALLLKKKNGSGSGLRPMPEPVRSEGRDTFSAPRDLLELQLTQIWEEVLNVKPVGISDTFNLGDDALAVRLMERIQQATGQTLSIQVLAGGGTVERLAILLREQEAQISKRSLVPLQVGGAEPGFFCVHPVGGGVLSYFELARRVRAAGHPVYGLQARGLDGEQMPSCNIEEMAAHYIEEIRTVQPEGPYHLGGWSLGGVIAFEMTRQLLAQGESVALLALLDSHISEAGKTAATVGGAMMLRDFASDLGIRRRSLGVAWEEVERLEAPERLGFVLDRAKSAGLVPSYVTYEVAERLFNIYRANLRALMKYIPRPAPCRALLFMATERVPANSDVQRVSWNRLAEQGVEVYQAGGNHYTMLQTPHVETLAAQLTVHLAAGKKVLAS
jgi:thioesterase domain-containing protein